MAAEQGSSLVLPRVQPIFLNAPRPS